MNSTTLENFGMTLAVTPRIGGDGTVTMQIDVETSRPGPEKEGVPIQTKGDDVLVRSPRIESATVTTCVRIPDGQTAVLSSSTEDPKSGKELQILVTPRIIKLEDAKRAQ
jgi:type II secretory pathway component GspD/PulD (secretin)